MNIYCQLLTIAVSVVYVVEVSGFTESWRAALARVLKVERLRALPPFDCAKCAVFWACIIWTLCTVGLRLLPAAFCCLLSLLAVPFGRLLIFIREGLTALVDKLIEKI